MDFENTIQKAINLNVVPISIDQVPADVQYVDKVLERETTRISIPQRKLFIACLTLLEYAENGDTLIYAGSAPGYNIEYLVELFPKVIFHLYDPRKTNVKRSLPNVTIFEKLFEIQDIQSYTDKSVLFFSDIRTLERQVVTEKCIRNDLDLQKTWVEKLKPKAFSLKFRLPFCNAQNMKTTSIDYLDGVGYLQPFTIKNTTEIRLVSDRIKYKQWSLAEHENRMFFVNKFIREWTRIDGECYECALEIRLLKKFFSNYGHTNDILKITRTNDLESFRKWINTRRYLAIANEQAFKVNGTLQDIVIEKDVDEKQNYHKTIIGRRIEGCLVKLDLIESLAKTLYERCYIKKEYDWFIALLRKHELLFVKALTHRSTVVSEKDSNERLEFLGDRLLNTAIACYLDDTFDESTNHEVLNNVRSMLCSGEISSTFFSKPLGIEPLLMMVSGTEDDNDKALEDAVEALLGAIYKCFRSEFSSDGVAWKVVYNVVRSILIDFNIEDHRNKIFVPKTELKELFDEQARNNPAWDFRKCYKQPERSSDDRYVKVRLDIPAGTISVKTTVLTYEEMGKEKRVEAHAALAFLKFLRNRDYYVTPKEKKLIFN